MDGGGGAGGFDAQQEVVDGGRADFAPGDDPGVEWGAGDPGGGIFGEAGEDEVAGEGGEDAASGFGAEEIALAVDDVAGGLARDAGVPGDVGDGDGGDAFGWGRCTHRASVASLLDPRKRAGDESGSAQVQVNGKRWSAWAT
jgi:hypothetical protein